MTRFQIGEFIHPPLDFDSLEALKEQLAEDVERVKMQKQSNSDWSDNPCIIYT